MLDLEHIRFVGAENIFMQNIVFDMRRQFKEFQVWGAPFIKPFTVLVKSVRLLQKFFQIAVYDIILENPSLGNNDLMMLEKYQVCK